MTPKNVLVLFGGTSPEHEISVASAENVIHAIKRHRIIPVYITKAGKWLLYDGKLENVKNIDWEKFGTPAFLSPDRVNKGLIRLVGDRVKIIPVDVVFPALHGQNGEDGTIQGLCQLAGIPYVGCGLTASAAAMDKGVLKLITQALKIPQADFLTFSTAELDENIGEIMNKIRYKLGYPCFVKPAGTGSSIGISKAANRKELQAALQNAAKFYHRIVVEKEIKGREIEVAILGNGTAARTSAPGEVIPDGEFYDYDAKYTKPASKTITPADLPEEITDKIQSYALQIFNAIDGKGMSRIDFFVTNAGKIYLNEINTVPGFTSISMYTKMWEASGISQEKLIAELIDISF